MGSKQNLGRVEGVTLLGLLAPAALMALDYGRGRLSEHPLHDLQNQAGWYALTLLVLTLAITPLMALTGWRHLQPARRWLGLGAFGYALAHLGLLVIFDYGSAGAVVREMLFVHRYMLLGALALMLMIPLALTSTVGWQKRLGKRWKYLHASIYFIGILAVVHFAWAREWLSRQPWLFAGVVTGLLFLRLPPVRRRLGALRQVWPKQAKAATVTVEVRDASAG